MSSEVSYPPGPRGLPVVGNTVDLSRDIFAFFEELRDDYGRVASYDVFGTDACMVAHPDAIQRVLLDDHEAFEKGEVLTRNLADAMGEGLFVTGGTQWQNQRTQVQPAFYRNRLNAYVPEMRATAEETVEEWRDGMVVDVNDRMTETTMDALGRTLFGVDVAENPVVSEASDAILARFDTSRFWSFLPDRLPTPTNRRYRRKLDELQAFVDELARQRRQQSPENRGDDLLSILVGFVEAGDLTRREFRDNMVTFLFAGHETTALGLTYTIHCLARHPDEQAALRAEVEAVCDGAVTAEDLPKLERLERAIDEALRLYPPVYMFFREATRNVELRGYTVPEGTTLVVPQWVVHRDPAWWDDPEAFRPERFSDSDHPEYAYFPFGGGPRHCIGMRFARMEMKTVLATILDNYAFRLVSDPNPDLIASTNLKPGEPIEIKLDE
ncbi:Cytochrome P450 [Halopelagius inordinatus]|uniref:Cytochrome P450 n=1 Tax=Halopelagius inordinatus TaxID=553467 RepID=A0A1I2X0G6_9EURY|nr:cytochrome P450 [Halopelagius inordinatus]SFH06176.1 Cytochrome P450 [Halopelagius inordinatus]